MTKRTYSTGDKPENPIVRDVVYFISDIREEPAIDDHMEGENTNPEKRWSYLVDKKMSIAEYLEWLKKTIDENLREMDEALFELDAGGA